MSLDYPLDILDRDTLDALEGTSGVPGDTNRYVTDADPRLVIPVTDHGALTGLADNDHPQYQLVSDKNSANGYVGLNASSLISPIYLDMGNVLPTAITVGSGTAGTSTTIARTDHSHPVSSGAPSSVGSANVEGTATALSRRDHVHSHGSHILGTDHAIVTTTKHGFMSSADKTTFNAIPTTYVPQSRSLTAGNGMVGGGTLASNQSFDIVTEDNSIVVNADSIRVGVVNDTQHGTRGGGTLHAVATAATAGFMSATDKQRMDDFITVGALAANRYDIYTSALYTTSNIYQLYRSWNAQNLEAGNYIVRWMFKFTTRRYDYPIDVLMKIDGVDFMNYIMAPGYASNERIGAIGVELANFSTDGDRLFEVYVRAFVANRWIRLYSSYIELIKVI